MATFYKFNSFVEAMAEKAHELETDTLKIALSNTTLSAGMTNLAAVTQITASGGYATGGKQITVSSSSQTSGTYKLVLADLVFTATGASMGPFRYVVLYNDTSTTDLLIGAWDYGSSITLADTETFTVDLSQTNGVLQIA
jgi:hypothetical protein